MGYLQQEMIRMDMSAEVQRIQDLERELAYMRTLYNDVKAKSYTDATDASIMHGMLEYFQARAVERGDTSAIAEAAKYALQDTGVDADTVLDLCHRLGYEVDRSDLCGEYRVSMTIPVYLTITVEAPDEETAQEIAPDMVADEGLCNYYLDWDTCNVEIDYVEEAE
jgi:hypothetical protein